MELEVIDQLSIACSGRICFDYKCSGELAVARRLHRFTLLAFVSEEFTMNDDLIVISGKFGVCSKVAEVEEFFVDKDGNKKGRNQIGGASPLHEINISRKAIIPLKDTDRIYVINSVDSDNTVIGVIGEIKL